MSEFVKIKVYVGTGYDRCDYSYIEGVRKEEWDGMTEEEREDFLNQLANDFRSNVIECCAWVMEEGKK